MEGKEVYLKEDIVWAFETFIRQLKSSEAIHPQTIRVVERLKSQIVEIVPTHEVGSPWHTGTPTEEGWYLLKLVDEYGRITYYANYLRKGKKGMEWKYAFFGHVIIKWQSIEDEPEVMMG